MQAQLTHSFPPVLCAVGKEDLIPQVLGDDVEALARPRHSDELEVPLKHAALPAVFLTSAVWQAQDCNWRVVTPSGLGAQDRNVAMVRIRWLGDPLFFLRRRAQCRQVCVQEVLDLVEE